MARICCLAAVAKTEIPLLAAALKGAGEPALTIIAHLTVPELRRLRPDVLVADVDGLETDALEMLRQLRFVLPDCVIVVYTASAELSWSRACHLAGASCVLAKGLQESQLASGLRQAIRIGCFADPRFVTRS
jgi:DNA-binding NarL/FixJ family response regulator